MKKYGLIGAFVLVSILFGIMLVRRTLKTNPESNQAQTPVFKAVEEPVKSYDAGSKTNGQKYKSFSEAGFEVSYPGWPEIDKKYLPELKTARLAVSDGKCSLVITAQAIPKSSSFKDYTKKLIDQQSKTYKSEILKNEVEDDVAYLEGKTVTGGVTLKTVSFSYLVGSSLSYSVGFISKDQDFDGVCGSYINDVVTSVVIN